MKVQIGEIIMQEVIDGKVKLPTPNKTIKYLAPMLKEYGDEFIGKFNNAFKIAIGIGDIVVDNCGFKHEKHLFILLDRAAAKTEKFFAEFLFYVRKQPSIYQDDYAFGNVTKSTQHMIVIKFPEKYYKSFETFKIGKYSQMFDKDTLDKFFQRHPKTQKVLIKDHEYKFYFVNKLNKMYGTKIDANEFEGELDLPPTDETEVFNHHIKKRNNGR